MYYSITLSIISHSLFLEDCTVTGALKTIHLEAEVQREVFRRFKITTETTSAFFRAVIKWETYYSRAYNRSKMRNGYTVEYIANGQQKYRILHFFHVTHSCCKTTHSNPRSLLSSKPEGFKVPVRVGSAISHLTF